MNSNCHWRSSAGGMEVTRAAPAGGGQRSTVLYESRSMHVHAHMCTQADVLG